MRDTSKRILWLLTLWCERPSSPGHPAVWRLSLEEAHTGKRRGFGSLEEMAAFLRARMEHGLERSVPDEECP